MNSASVVVVDPLETEKLLRTEIHGLADRMHRHFQWGVTLMVSLQTALFFVRKEAAERLNIPKGQEFPLYRYLIGSFALLLLAIILCYLTLNLSKFYMHYAKQLAANHPSGIQSPNFSNRALLVLTGTYFVFPALDILVRIYINLRSGFISI